jgi:hypothetical protein
MEIAVSVQPIGSTRSTRAISEITLSKREQEVLQWAAEGKTEWEIGLILRSIRAYCGQVHSLGAPQASRGKSDPCCRPGDEIRSHRLIHARYAIAYSCIRPRVLSF